MRAVLCSEIPVDRVVVFAEMAFLERRPELGLVCRAARQNGNRLSIGAMQSVLPGLADAGGRNIIAWCRMLGLCDAQGSLTAQGEDVAESDEAPVPEQGVYALWLAQHPVIGRRILSVERLSSKREPRFEAIRPLTVAPTRGVVFRSVVEPKQRFQLRDLPSNHGQPSCLPEATKATCRLRWTLDFDGNTDQWQLEGMIEVPQNGMKPMQHEPESDGIDLWGLAATWGLEALSSFGKWQPTVGRLAVALSGLNDTEQNTFLKTIKLRHVNVPGKGAYADVTLEDVPIGPTSSEEAGRWALSRLDRHLAREVAYRSRGEVRRLFADLTEGTPLEHFNPTLPAHDTLVGGQLLANKPEVFWSLAASVDLAPRPVPRSDLDALRIGAPSAESAASERAPVVPGVISVPYRAGWSMRRFMDSITAGGVPSRILLCDRYVRGAENMASLKLLVQTARQANASVQFHVWTGAEEADFKQIQAITGTAPRAWRELFGRSAPHDRYLLVVPGAGDGFGWQMSNSPLDARADVVDADPETPLRSRGLVAVRMSAEQLPERLGQWINGGGR